MIQYVEKPFNNDISHFPAISSMKSSSGTINLVQNKKSTLHQLPERKRVLCELMLQLTKVTLTLYDRGQTL